MFIEKMEEQQERIVKGIWIPIEIWKDKNLTWNEKILFLEIDSYTSKDKDCYFSNEYISELLGISLTNASKTISSLIEKGYIIKTKFDGRKRYIKSALSYSTSQTCQERQPSHACVYNVNTSTINDDLINKDNKKELKEKDDSLFEKCWLAYRRKGKRGKAKTYWDKLSENEKAQVLLHIRAYIQTRDLQYQQDFERYLRDKTFKDLVFKNSMVIYDPTRFENGIYAPQGRDIWFNEETKSYWSTYNFYDERIYDGYDDDNRPDGAEITLNNARGTYKWNSNCKKWEKKQDK